MGGSEGKKPRELGTPGASARREQARRRARREQRTRARHPRIGGLILALQDAPRHEVAWGRGAGGEQVVATKLGKSCSEAVVILHDRRVPRSRANIDHLAVGPSGVWVIDSKRYRGKVSVSKPLFGRAKLTIGGRDRSRLVEGLARQVQLVEAAIAEISAGIPVRGAVCFVEADLPVIRKLEFGGFPLLRPRQLGRRVSAGGPVAQSSVPAIAARLDERFPSA